MSSIGATNIYINLEILEVAEIIENCIFIKFIITKKKKNLINNIYYLTKCHLHNFCFKKKKKSMIRMVKNMILYKKYKKKKKNAKQFS